MHASNSKDWGPDQKVEIDEPEVLPPEVGERTFTGGLLGRLEETFGPIIAGVIIDTVDIATFGKFGLMMGMLIGGSAAWWMCSIYRLPVWQRFLWALASGIYCTAPRTELIPLATMIGAFARFRQSKSRVD